MPYCPNCGKEVLPPGTDKNCLHCGKPLYETVTPVSRTSTRVIPYKSPGTSALIAFIGAIFGLPGLGHLYIGRVGRGLAIVFSGLILYILGMSLLFSGMLFNGLNFARSMPSLFGGMRVEPGFLFAVVFGLISTYVVIWFWQIFNARKLAHEFNQSVLSTGKEPW